MRMCGKKDLAYIQARFYGSMKKAVDVATWYVPRDISMICVAHIFDSAWYH